ncbi:MULTISPECIES: hypothetical protein [Halomicrobium]|uniref:Uncharacterized protein n=2 Tax=Halomicrobium mukohataei TaxID=57705 RepID=C7NY02_HALMD|nr:MULTISPECIES: hypothetical protein [Halomicrobium]ACV48462.1 hypothetical protein Hmuk_2350 [Halomicrobium mukohataei DSM 12286]QCD66866.1 hypothetical protein E5139_14875 [Halomicrobium mukohataei]QFR21676.1 hypothetical protein GBQ70_14890 [Halomicrobium sp. ZPS1]
MDLTDKVASVVKFTTPSTSKIAIMASQERDIIDRLGRVLVVVALGFFVVPLAIGFLLATLGLSLRPLYVFLVSGSLVYGMFYLQYGQHLHEVI